MNDIPVKQNTHPFLRLLRARARVYAVARRYQLAQIAVAVALPILGAVLGLMVPESRPYVGAVAVIAAILDAAWLDRVQRLRLKIAAKISEEFDCELLGLPWNDLVAGNRIDPETIEAAALSWGENDTQLRNWYRPVEIGEAPLPLARLIAQRENLWYDSSLRRRTGGALVGTAVLIAAGLFLAGLALGLTMVDFVLTVVVPVAPILTWAVRESFRQQDAAEEAETIKAAAEALWAASVDNTDMGALDRRAREFQDAIHARRKARPLPVPFVYDLLRPSMEKEMRAGAAGLLGQLGIVVPSPGAKERASI